MVCVSITCVIDFLGNDLEVQLPECDILMIDTLHTYDQLLKELKLLSGKTKRYILMHDTSPPVCNLLASCFYFT